MLTFESPFYEIAGIVIFRDHAVPTLFHYLAGPPRLARDEQGRPHMLLLKYRHALDAMGGADTVAREQLGGGFLLLEVECGLARDSRRDDDVRREIVQQLGTLTSVDSEKISLVPVLYTKGKVNVLALDAQQPAEGASTGDAEAHKRFVRGVQGTSTPSLLDDQRAIFSISLTPDAVTLIEEAYRSELSPIGVMYELEFAGLRPALAVKAHVEKKKVYEFFKAGLHLGVHSGGGQQPGTQPQTQPQTQPTTQPQTQPQTQPGQPPGQPQTQPQTPPAQGQGQTQGGGQTSRSGTQVAISADLSYAMEKLEESGAIQIEIIRQQEGTSVDEMQRQALDLLKESILNEFFQPAMTGAPAAGAAGAGGQGGVASALGAAQQAQQLMAGSGQTNTGIAGGGTRVELGFQLQFKKEEELRTADYDFSVIQPETRTHAPNGFFSALLRGTEQNEHIREIDLDDPFFKILDVDVTTTADFDGLDLKTLVVELQYGGTVASPRVTGTATFTKGDTAPRHFQAFRDLDDFSYRYRVAYKFGQAEGIGAKRQDYQTPWRTTTSRALVIHPPDDVAMLRVFVEPGVVDWDIVEKIDTVLTYDDPAHGFHAERRFLLDSAFQRQPWLVRLEDPARTEYQVKSVWHLKDESEIEGPAEARRGSQLFVGDPFVDRLPIVIHPLVDRNNVLRVEVELHYEDEANGLDVRKNVEVPGPDFRPANVTLPIVDRERREYSYRVILIKANGGTEMQLPQRTEQLSILVTEGGIYFDVNVTLLGAAAMAQNGVDAIQIDLRSEPLDGELQRVESHLFEPGGEAKLTRRLLLRSDRPRRFEFRTTVFTAANGPKESDWTPHESSILPLQVTRLLNA